MTVPLRRLGSIALVLASVLSACTPDATDATPVGVDLANDRIALGVTEVAPGTVTFEVHNTSTDLVHEIEVFANAQSTQVLTVDNGVADVTGLDLVDEVEDIVPGAGATLTVGVEPGMYLIMCNLPGHYAAGMWAYLVVG